MALKLSSRAVACPVPPSAPVSLGAAEATWGLSGRCVQGFLSRPSHAQLSSHLSLSTPHTGLDTERFPGRGPCSYRRHHRSVDITGVWRKQPA